MAAKACKDLSAAFKIFGQQENLANKTRQHLYAKQPAHSLPQLKDLQQTGSASSATGEGATSSSTSVSAEGKN